MAEMLTVNIQLKIPVEKDSAGRRKGIINLIHPYISSCYGNVIELPPYNEQDDYDIYERISNEETMNSVKEYNQIVRT